MNWLKIIGFGALLWVLMFAIVSAFVSFKIYENIFVMILTAIIAGVISFILAGFLKPEKIANALLIGIIFVAVGLVLDFFISTKFAPEMFTSWSLWLGYALVLLAPMLKVKGIM